MKRFVISIALLLLLATAGNAQAEFPQIPGWTVASEPGACDRESLWEYINGAAEQYLNYGYQELNYCDVAAGELVVTVNLYDMGSPINAFGLYTIQKPGKAKPLSIGGETAILPPYQCLMYKDRFFVMADVYEGEFTDESGLELMKAIAKALPGADAPPAQLALLPEKLKIAGSEGYTPKGFLGLQELPSCLHADYAFSDKITGKVFIIASDSGAAETWQALAKKWKAKEMAGQSVLLKTVPYKGSIGIAKTESGLIGISGFESEADLLVQLKLYAQP